jgi:hypothetical protein
MKPAGPPMTLSNMRELGVRALNVLCLLWFGPRILRTYCGTIGADAWPSLERAEHQVRTAVPDLMICRLERRVWRFWDCDRVGESPPRSATCACISIAGEGELLLRKIKGCLCEEER